MTPRAGVTLLELMIVLVILSILAAVTTPALRGFGTQDETTRTRGRLAIMLTRARETALETGHEATLTIDPRRGRYWVTEAASASIVALAEDTISVANTLSRVTAEPRLRFVFAHDGSARAGSVSLGALERGVGLTLDRWTGESRAATR
jgi:prepilin-type N-terminal cleavage/methylation domain-containing protein